MDSTISVFFFFFAINIKSNIPVFTANINCTILVLCTHMCYSPYCNQISPKPYKRYLWTESFKYVSVVTAGFLDARAKFCVRQCSWGNDSGKWIDTRTRAQRSNKKHIFLKWRHTMSILSTMSITSARSFNYLHFRKSSRQLVCFYQMILAKVTCIWGIRVRQSLEQLVKNGLVPGPDFEIPLPTWGLEPPPKGLRSISLRSTLCP